MEKPVVVQIDGGIGRVICSIPALETLAKSRKVIVVTSYPEVFYHNPNIYKVYPLTHAYLWDDVIRHGEFAYPEPYHHQDYYNQTLHLMQVFNLLLTGDGNIVTHPNLYLTEEENAWAKKFLDERRQERPRPVVLLQCFGSSAVLSNNVAQDNSKRSLPLNVVDAICRNTDPTYINISHLTLDYPNVWQHTFTLRQIFALAAHCAFIVGVDSFLLHVGNCFGKSGVAFFGGTYPQNLGYPHYQLIQRKGFPKSYVPNRFSGFVDENSGAMDFDNVEIGEILKLISHYAVDAE
jgi:hypothetical protein